MERPKVFVTRCIPDIGLEKLHAACQVDVWQGGLPPERDVLMEKVRGVDGILCLLSDRVDREVMDAAGSQLKAISTYAVGTDNIDLEEATRRGIPVGHTPGVLTEACADLAFALLMAAARQVVLGDRQVREGLWRTWEPQGWLGVDIHRATLGLVGFGRIGQAVARRAAGFAMRVLYYDPAASEPADGIGQAAELDELLRESDFVSLHAPLTPDTRHLINRESIKKMKAGAILVNTARGGLVDQEALAEGLASGHLAGAALDVTDPEPIPPGHALLGMENVTITPHIASASRATRDQMARIAADNLLAGLRGERLPFCANPQVYGD
jgi:lactate dehydrogenase-like 2-hydroxyacid dehydrogenase